MERRDVDNIRWNERMESNRQKGKINEARKWRKENPLVVVFPSFFPFFQLERNSAEY